MDTVQKEKMDSIFKQVTDEELVAILVHPSPDPDCLGAAAGFALTGLTPFVMTLAVFVSMRACEQIRTDIAYTNLNVKIFV